MNKQVDMIAFVGKDFDCVRGLSSDIEGEICRYTPDFDEWYSCRTWQRPRLNKAQVLYDWSWVPDGLVWNVITVYEDSHNHYENVLSASLSSIPDTCNFVVAACIGVELSYELWGKERGMPVVNV